jgi:hypothetical protein
MPAEFWIFDKFRFALYLEKDHLIYGDGHKDEVDRLIQN